MRAGVGHAPLTMVSAEVCNQYSRGDIKALDQAVARVEA